VTALFGLGVPELAVIAGVAALIFGPKKLPEIGKSLGKTVKSFQEVPITIYLLFSYLLLFCLERFTTVRVSPKLCNTTMQTQVILFNSTM
jgi:TatA/E family protein of Tat protein translocase